jgi:predicted RND superfamily exporter protein
MLDRYLALCARRPGRVVAGGALVALVALGLAGRLRLSTDLAELLPAAHPSVAALHELAAHERLGANVIVLVDSPDRAANLRFVEALRPRLAPLSPALFADIDWGPDPTLRAFVRRWAWLYADLASLERAEALFDRLFLRRANPLLVSLDDDDPREELRQLRTRLEGERPAAASSPYFEGVAGGVHRVGLLLWKRRDGLATASDRRALAAVRAAVEATAPARFHPGLRVRYTGTLVQAIEGQEAFRHDLTAATGLCTTLILLVIYLYFRRLAVVAVVGVPAVVGLLVTLAIAAPALGALNTETAFLVSIILGNGINFPIVLLARFGEERAHGVSPTAAVRAAVLGSVRGTLAAMGAAGVAYGSLLATRFRGCSQFGALGALGMVLVWLATFLLVPALVHLGERWRPGCLTPPGLAWRGVFGALGRLAERRPRAVLLVALGLGLAGVVPLARLAAHPLEWDLRRLRPAQTPAGELWAEAEALGMTNPEGGYVGSHGALLVDHPAQAEGVAEALRTQDRAMGAPVFKRVRTFAGLLPAQQAEKLATLARIRSKFDRRAVALDEDDRRELVALRPPDDLRPVQLEDLPATARRAFTERDGTVGRLVLVSVDRRGYSDWNGHDLVRLSHRLSVNALGRRWVAASPATVFAGMIESLREDGPRITLVALVGIIAFLSLTLGRRWAWLALAAQGLALVWFGGALGTAGLAFNFFNFVGLPITLGVGADYAANILARARDGDSLASVVGSTGSAVALCSLTTILGYSALLVSESPALRSFGVVADLGELCCLAAALVFLPALLAWRNRRRPRPTSGRAR